MTPGLINRNETYSIAILPGDGIGKEVMDEALKVLKAFEKLSDHKFELVHCEAGALTYQKSGSALPDNTIEECKKADAVLLGAMGLPGVRYPDGKELTPQIDLREKFELFSGIRPTYLYHANDTPLKKHQKGEIDFVIVRESTEGLFSARLSKSDPQGDQVQDVMLITRKGSERVIRSAFDLAMTRRKKVTLVDKANVLPSMVFLRKVFDEIALEYPEVETERCYVDAAALFLVQKPQSFDVLVTENMFGDILSDLSSSLIGGMGMAPSADIGPDLAVFQPAHGTAPDIAGQGIANPVGMILSVAMMLDWLPNTSGADIHQAVTKVLADPENRTPDMGGKLSTSELTHKVVEVINANH